MSDSQTDRTGDTEGLNLAISLCLTYTLCIVLVRLWIRKGAFGYDDLVVLVTTIFSLAHTAADYVALSDGLGKPWQQLIAEGHLSSLNNASVASIVTFTIALYLSKLCVLAFLCRITKNQKQINVYYTCGAFTIALALVAVLTVTAKCHAGAGLYWSLTDNTRSCANQPLRWKIYTAFDIITEILLLALPVQLVWDLQMPVRKKAMVLVAFYLRTPVIAFSAIRNYFTLQLSSPYTDPGEGGAMVVIWMEIELAYALAASTLSALKAFTESFNSGFGQGFTRGQQYDTPGFSKDSGHSSHHEKRRLGTSAGVTVAGQSVSDPNPIELQSSRSSTSVSPDWQTRPSLHLRPDKVSNITQVTAAPAHKSAKHDTSNGSDGSGDDMFIVRETELSVHHDEYPILKNVR